MGHIESGTVFENRYQIEEILGAGGMGEVYVAHHTTLGRKVALKRLHAQYTSNPDVVQRFIREANLAASIGHDNICEVIDVGTADDGSPYLVMPMLKGCTLCDLIENEQKLPIRRFADIICQTLSALSAAHEARIVHRDLKPDNIFISSYGDRDDFVKLLDFGISKILDQDSVSQLTQTGTVLGTPYYMAPEQARGARTIDHRVDIYAMGVILYECLTGIRPYEGHSYNEIMFKIMAEPFDAPRVVDPSIPAVIERIVLRAMSKDPEERFSTAIEMRSALKAAILETGTRISTPPALTSSGTKMEKANAFTPTEIDGKAIPTPGTCPGLDTNELQFVAPQKNSRKPLVLFALVITILVGTGLGIFAATRIGEEAPPENPIPVELPVEPVPELAKTNEQVKEPELTLPETPPEVSVDENELKEAVQSTSEPEKRKSAKKSSRGSNRRTAEKPKEPERSVIITETKPKPTKKKEEKALKGRFGTTFTPVYE